MDKYFYTDGKEKYGPYSKQELGNQNISRRTKVWCYGMDTWTELSQVPALHDVLESIPPDLKPSLSEKEERQKKNPETKSQSEKETKSTSLKSKKNRITTLSKWAIAIFTLVIVSIFIYFFVQNQLKTDEYNEIVENAYKSDENFNMYVQKFYRDLEIYGMYPEKPEVQIIKFSKLDQNENTTHIHGVSYGTGNDDKIEIYINPSTWKKFNKPMRYFLMYHELAHDVLNLDDLEAKPSNEGKLMYPSISSYEQKSMDDFIESYKSLFEEQLAK